MGIIYLFFLAILYILFLLLKKTDKKQNLFFWISIGIICLMSYNVFITYLLDLINIKCRLSTLSIINILFSALMAYKIIKTKSIQTYYLRVRDIIYFSLLLIVVGCIAYTNFGFPFNIKYETTDPAVHYMSAIQFYNNSQLLDKVPKATLYDFETFMTGAYVNVGLLFKAFSGLVSETHFYKIFIFFDILMLLLSGMLFYSSIIDKLEKKSLFFIGVIISIIYILGYPLNNMIFGFFYLGIGILIINGIICLIKYFKENDFDNVQLLTLMFLLNFALFFTYYLFIPVVYSALGIYFLWIYRKGKLIISKKSILVITITLIIPFIMGCIYFILPGILGIGNSVSAATTLATEGYIYRNLYSNFIFILPFSLFFFINSIKNKKFEFNNLLFLILALFIFALFIGGMKGKVSSYYYFKNYFVLWLIMFVTGFYGIVEICKNHLILIYTCIFVYLSLICISVLGIDKKITQKNILFNPTDQSIAFTDIFRFNFNKVNSKKMIYNVNELQVLDEFNAIVDDKNNVPVVGTTLQQLWFYSIFDSRTKDNLSEFYNEEYIDLNKWTTNQYRHLIYFNNDYFTKNKEVIKQNTNKIFTNDAGGILVKYY